MSVGVKPVSEYEFVAEVPTCTPPTSFGTCCVNCARANCDKKNSAPKIRAKPPNNLDDLTCEIGHARAVTETSCRIRNQTPDLEFGMICARVCLARPTAAPNRTRPTASLDIEFWMCCPLEVHRPRRLRAAMITIRLPHGPAARKGRAMSIPGPKLAAHDFCFHGEFQRITGRAVDAKKTARIDRTGSRGLSRPLQECSAILTSPSLVGCTSSFRTHTGRLDDTRPARDLTLDEGGKRLLPAVSLFRNFLFSLLLALGVLAGYCIAGARPRPFT